MSCYEPAGGLACSFRLVEFRKTGLPAQREAPGLLNLKGYKEFEAENRPEGWNVWLTFAISPAAAPPVHGPLVRK